MVNREKRMRQEIYRISEQFRNRATSADERTEDYLFVTQIKYNIGESE